MNLGELIDTHRAGRSYNELARDSGAGGPSGKRLQQLATGTIRNFPDPPTIRALARGLRVSHEAVILAAAESLELDVRRGLPRVVDLLPVSARDLSEEQAAAIGHLIRVFLEPQTIEVEDGLVGIDDELDGPAPTVADQLAARRRAEDEPRYSDAARDVGKLSKGQQRRAADAAGEPETDDPSDDMEPR